MNHQDFIREASDQRTILPSPPTHPPSHTPTHTHWGLEETSRLTALEIRCLAQLQAPLQRGLHCSCNCALLVSASRSLPSTTTACRSRGEVSTLPGREVEKAESGLCSVCSGDWPYFPQSLQCRDFLKLESTGSRCRF